MLNNFNLFLKEIKRLNLIEEDSYFVPNIGRVKVNEAPAGLSNSFQKIKLIDIVPTKENYLKDLQSDAINEIMLLNKDQLQNCLNRLKSFDTFSRFYKFWGGFYVKYTKNEFDNRDLFDLQMTLKGYFTVEYPKNAQIHFDFIHDLQDEIFLKDGYLDGLIFEVNEIANPKKIASGDVKPYDNKLGVNTLEDIFNEPYKARYEDFLKLLNTAFDSDPVLNEDLQFNNLSDNIQCLAVFFRELKARNIIDIKLTNVYAEFISSNIRGMGTKKAMFSNTKLGSQKYSDNLREINRKLDSLIKSIQD